METYRIVGLILSLLIISARSEGPDQEVSDRCLGCICEASTGCQKDIGCTEAGVCGPMLISWPFWADAGKYVIKGTSPNDGKAYSECANDLYCAGATIRGYIAKYKKDCNGDGRIDCEDFARIHKLGYGACNSPSFEQSEYYSAFKRCSAAVNP